LILLKIIQTLSLPDWDLLWTIPQKVDNKMEIGKMDKGGKNGPTEIR
jgi:hypothetical protein